MRAVKEYQEKDTDTAGGDQRIRVQHDPIRDEINGFEFDIRTRHNSHMGTEVFLQRDFDVVLQKKLKSAEAWEHCSCPEDGVGEINSPGFALQNTMTSCTFRWNGSDCLSSNGTSWKSSFTVQCSSVGPPFACSIPVFDRLR